MSAVVVIDCPPASPAPTMWICGMTVLERVLREAARAGATRALVRGDAVRLPALPPLPLAVEIVGADTAAPAGAALLSGDTVAGVRITDERSRRAARQALLQGCRPSYDGPGDRYLIRPLAVRIAALLTHLPVTPNQVTGANIAVGLAACALAARGGRLDLVAAGALMFLQLVLDSCDGVLARLLHRQSRLGMWLDNASDDVIDNLFVLSLGLGLGGPWSVIGLAAAAARGFSAVMIYRAVAAAGQPGDVLHFRWWFDHDDGDRTARFNGPGLRSLLRSLGRRDVYPLIWGVACAAGAPAVALGFGALMCAVYFVLAVVHLAVTRGRPTESLP